MKAAFLAYLTVAMYLSRSVISMCPSICVCDHDEQGQKRVRCENGGVSIPGNFQLADLDQDVEVLNVGGPTYNPNVYRLTGDMFQGRRFTEIHLTNSQSEPAGIRLYQNVADTLQVLNLTHNKITTLTENTFRNLSRLTELYLSDNNIEDVPSVFGFGTINLEVLDLSRNPIGGAILDRTFVNFPKLRIVKVAGIGIVSLPEFIFTLRTNTKVEELDLSENQLIAVLPSHLSPLGSLKRLNLSRNSRLEIIAAGAFAGADLDSLSLQGLPSDLLKSGMFQGAIVKHLDLSGMNMTVFNPNIFAPIAQHLISLDISGNSDLVYHSGMYNSFVGLKNLSLAHTGVDTLTPDLFSRSNVLQHLDLSRNRLSIAKVEDEFFTSLPKLITLDLADNELTQVPFGLRQLPKLQSLDLSQNRLTSFPESAIAYFASPYSALKSLRLNDNPWLCDCGVASLGRWLKGYQTGTSGYEVVCVGNGNFSCPVCAEPYPLSGTPLNYLPENFRFLENCAPEHTENRAQHSSKRVSIAFSLFIAVFTLSCAR